MPTGNDLKIYRFEAATPNIILAVPAKSDNLKHFADGLKQANQAQTTLTYLAEQKIWLIHQKDVVSGLWRLVAIALLPEQGFDWNFSIVLSGIIFRDYKRKLLVIPPDSKLKKRK